MDKVTSAIVAEIVKDKRISVKPAQVKAALFLFVKAVIVNPTFSSQTKVECTSKIHETIDIKPKFIKDTLGCGVWMTLWL